MAPTLWRWCLAGGIAASALFRFAGGTGKMLLYVGVGFLPVAGIVGRLRLGGTRRRFPWHVLVLATALYGAANALWFPLTVLRPVLPFPSFVDAMFLVAYTLLVLGLVLVVAARTSGRDRGGPIDALAIAFGLGVLSWVFLIAHDAEASELSLVARAVSIAYPFFDVMLLAAMAWLALSPGERRPSYRLLVGFVVLQLAADTVYARELLTGTFGRDSLAFLFWMLSWTCLAAAALHPSAATLTEPGEASTRMRPLRVLVLAAAALVAPVTEFVWHQDSTVVEVIGIVVLLLVMARVAVLLVELAAARDAALESGRMQSAFLATMSHEIRTPMNAVIGLTGLLLDSELNRDQRTYAEGVRKAGEGLLSVINDVLDFSKIEAGKLELELLPFEPRRVLDDAADLMAEAARAKGISLVSYCLGDVPPVVVGDAGRLRQVLLNLMGNAVKFTERGEVTARGRVQRNASDEPPGALLRFEVADTGIGIPEEGRAALFERFRQADSSSTRRFGGTGLGLAISRRLVEMMGGDIGVDSEPGRGSTFWFSVPFPLGTPASGSPREEEPLRGLRVLVVDDDETNRMILGHQLAAWGIVAASAVSAAEALGLLRAGGAPYDVLLLDTLMPDVDGIELGATIRQDPAIPDAPMVMLTSSDLPSSEITERSGIRHVLRKPVRQSQLYDTLLDVTGRGPPAPAPAAVGNPRVRRGRVLLVEDNLSNQLVGVKTLEALGCKVDVAANGQEAVVAVARRSYALVFMDAQMPGMDGYEATQEIRRTQPADRRIPIVALTASAMQGDRDRALAAGMDDYLTKPLRREEIARILDRYMPLDDAGAGALLPVPATAGPAPTRQRDPPPPTVTQPAGTGPAGLDPGRWRALEELDRSSSTGVLHELVGIFLSETPDRIVRLQELAGGQDRNEIRRIAHLLNGGSSAIGATGMHVLCAQIENLALDGGSLTEPVRLLAAEFEGVRAGLSDWTGRATA